MVLHMQIPARALAAALACGALAGSASAGCDVDTAALAARLKLAGVTLLDKAPPGTRCGQKPDYPKLAELNGATGNVWMLLLIARDGQVAVRVVLGSEPFGYFEDTALGWAKSFSFAPADAGDKADYRAMISKIRFSIEVR